MTLNEFKAFVEGVVSAGTTDSQALKLILEKLKTVSMPLTPETPAWTPRDPNKYYAPSPFEGPPCGNAARTAVGVPGDYHARSLELDPFGFGPLRGADVAAADSYERRRKLEAENKRSTDEYQYGARLVARG